MGTVTIRKRANAFVPDAAPSPVLPFVLRPAIDRFKRKHGGLWVGGTVSVAESGVGFAPNKLNRLLHDHLGPVSVPATDIRAVRCESGWVTDIVVVEHAGGELRFRCYGARKLAALLAATFNVPR
jgi:hypothetical protein